MAVGALVCGIIALLSGLAGFLVLTIPLAILLGLVAIVLGIVGSKRARDSGIGRGQAIAGIVTGALGLVAAILWVAGFAALVPAFEEMLDDPQLQEELEDMQEQSP